MSRPVIRFAPSPNGQLHLGHALSALQAHETARRLGGRFLLRIEDIDPGRCRPEFEAAIYRDLAWLGIEWEQPVRRQSDYYAGYEAALDELAKAGLIYRSYDSRREIKLAIAQREQAMPEPWPRDPDGAPLYPGASLSAEEASRREADSAPFVLRLDMARAKSQAGPLFWLETGVGPGGESGEIAAVPGAWGDVVLARRDCPTSYHLAVVVDDALQGISHVVRGADLFWATSVHRLLQRLLGLPAPIYLHHRLVRDGDGRKLSKSARDTGLATLRDKGVTPAEIRRMVGFDQ